jgi:hypothetical protein
VNAAPSVPGENAVSPVLLVSLAPAALRGLKDSGGFREYRPYQYSPEEPRDDHDRGFVACCVSVAQDRTVLPLLVAV